jgi:hypothetical protein
MAMRVVMRTGAAMRIEGAMRVNGVIGDAAPSVVTSRASAQPWSRAVRSSCSYRAP